MLQKSCKNYQFSLFVSVVILYDKFTSFTYTYVYSYHIQLYYCMITPNIATALDVLVEKTLPKLYLLPQTQSLIVKGSRKWDRLDNKLMKEAIKINKREYNS